MPSTSLARALVLTSSAVALCSTFAVQTAAQSQGDVQIRSAAQSVTDSLDSLEQLLLAPPEETNRLSIYVTPQYRRDRYEAYSESGQIFDGNTFRGEFPVEVDSPDFTVDSTGIAVGADYLLDNQWIFGGQLSYTNAEFDYDTPSELDAVTSPVELNNGDVLIGDPVEREFDEYGFSISAGYIARPWTALFTLGYSHRNNETETRKNGIIAPDDDLLFELIGLEADFNSDIYSADLGASYRIGSESLSLQPFASIGYQIEDIEGYSEEITSVRQRRFVDDPTFFTADPSDAILNVSSDVDGQTIHSVPGKIGVLFSAPLNSITNVDDNQTSSWRVRSGFSFTHDFSDQKRRIRSVSNEDFFESPTSVTYEEKNRNRNFFSLTAALGFDFSAVNGSLNYQRDIGLDERKSADILSLQLRVPL